MNKDVVYIEPEEDITDVIGKIEAAKSKIVAIVPPKKAGVFKSIVNIKLIMKTAANVEKTAVLVTTDPAIVKLAAATKMPVTKDLKSAPKIPEEDDIEEAEDTEVVDVDDEAEEEPKEEEKDEDKKSEEEAPEDEKDDDEDDDEEGDEDDDEEEDKDDDKEDKKAEEKPKKSDKKPKKAEGKLANSNNPVLRWIGTHKKADIAIGVGFVLFVFIMVWAFVIAPAATITLKLETVRGNFSESVSFTDKLADENVTEGKFYIEEKKIEDKTEVEFEATGKKNVGDKAKGDIVLTYYFPVNSDGGTISIKSGTSFTNNSKNYATTADASIHWDGDVTAAKKDCENFKEGDNKWKTAGCKVSTKVSVEATDSGAAYNLGANAGGWSSPISGVSVTGNSAIGGGTDKTVTVVQQSDIDKAINDMTSGSDNNNSEVVKQKLLDQVEEGQFPIESSFKLEASDPASSPKVGEEVKEGEKAKLTVTTTATIFVIDETKVKEFITEKAKLDSGYKIYEMNDPFVENFVKTDNGYVGKLKTSYKAGSSITENEVVETAKGKGIGTAKRDLSDNFNGIKSIDISTSVPWVTSIPGNTEKITVIINVEE